MICDLGPTNRKCLYKNLSISEDKLFIECNGNPVYVIFYIPHLLKCLRNTLKNYNVEVLGNVASWSHIAKMYDINREKITGLHLAPKLTEAHVKLPAFSRLKVKLASQIFSHSVYAALMVYTSMGKLPPEAIHTAVFIENINNLFDVLNSASLKHKKFRRAITERNKHIDVLQNAIQLFESIKVVKARGETVPNIKGWLISLNSIICLWNHLKEEYGLRFLLTSCLNQDCLENAFSTVRQKGGFNDNPDPLQFRHSLKKIITASLLTPSDIANCKDDTDNFLLNISDLSRKSSFNHTAGTEDILSKSSTSEVTDEPSETDDELSELNLPEQNAVVYVAGYIVKKVLRNHSSCVPCSREFISHSKQFCSDDQTFLLWKDYKGQNGTMDCLVVPAKKWVEAISGCEKLTLKHLPRLIHLPNVRARLIDYFMSYGYCKYFCLSTHSKAGFVTFCKRENFCTC